MEQQLLIDFGSFVDLNQKVIDKYFNLNNFIVDEFNAWYNGEYLFLPNTDDNGNFDVLKVIAVNFAAPLFNYYLKINNDFNNFGFDINQIKLTDSKLNEIIEQNKLNIDENNMEYYCYDFFQNYCDLMRNINFDNVLLDIYESKAEFYSRFNK